MVALHEPPAANAQQTAREVTAVSMNDERLVAVGGMDGLTVLWDSVANQVRLEYSRQSDWVHGMALSPDGQYLATASLDHSVKLSNFQSGALLHTYSHPDQVFSVDISADNQYVLTACNDNQTRLWGLATEQVVQWYSAGSVKSAALSPDSLYVATGSRDHIAGVFDRATAAEIRQFIGHTDHVKDVRLSSDNRYLVSRAADGSARLWDVTTGQTIREFTNGSGISVWDLAITPDNLYLLTGNRGGTCTQWELQTGSVVRTFAGHTSSVRSICINPGGRYLASGSMDGTARVWEIATGQQLAMFDFSSYTGLPANQPPVAVANSVTTNEDTGATIFVLANDTDPDGDPLVVSAVTQSSNGSVVNNLDGTVAYQPFPNFNGTDSFKYTVDDGKGGVATAQVTVTVNPVNDAPQANAGADQTVSGNAAVTLNGSGSGDPDGESVTYTWKQLSGPVVTLNGKKSASATFTAPAVTATTSLSFRLTVKDPSGTAGNDTITVTVLP